MKVCKSPEDETCICKIFRALKPVGREALAALVLMFKTPDKCFEIKPL